MGPELPALPAAAEQADLETARDHVIKLPFSTSAMANGECTAAWACLCLLTGILSLFDVHCLVII